MVMEFNIEKYDLFLEFYMGRNYTVNGEAPGVL